MDTTKNRVLFLHIPKTAGTSLSAYMQDQYSASDIELHIENHILGKTKESFQLLNHKFLLSAHLKYDTLRESLDIERFFTITLLRDPWKQTLSHLSWMKHIGFPENHKQFQRYPDYIKEIVERMHTLDWQAYFETMNDHEKNFFDNCQTRYFLPTYGDTELNDAALFNATQNLRYINLVGTIENFQRFIILLTFYLGWQPPQEIPRKNLSQQKYSIDPAVEGDTFEAYLQKLTAYDQKLYQYALEMFEREVKNVLHIAYNRFPELSGFTSMDWDPFEQFVRQQPGSSKPNKTLRDRLSGYKRVAKSKLRG
jgi:hypothetical protein